MTMKRPRDVEPDEAEVFAVVDQQVAGAAARIGPCPPPRRLWDAHAGRLDDTDARSTIAHAASCTMCQALLEAVDDTTSGEPDEAERRRLDTQVAAAMATARGRRTRLPTLPWRWRAVAALSAAATLAWFVLPWGAWRTLTLPPPSAPPHPVARAATPVRSVLVAERLDTRDMGLASLAWRGDATGAPPWPAFDEARLAFDRGRFSEAQRHLAAVTARTPAFGDAWLLLGVSRLFLERPVDAVAPLTRAREVLAGTARDDATWHLAVALDGAGRDEEAHALLAAMCAGSSTRAPMACLALDDVARP